jgi:hypothetical protein
MLNTAEFEGAETRLMVGIAHRTCFLAEVRRTSVQVKNRHRAAYERGNWARSVQFDG